MKLIEFKNVTKYYNNKSIGISDCTLEFSAGKIYGLVGPNGSGKSTILKILNGLLTIEKGTLSYFGNFDKITQYRDYFGYIPDSESVWKSLTAKEFVIYINQLFKKKIDQDFQKKYNTYLQLFDLKERENELLENYSFGMKKKIQIIATLLHEPLFMSIDEPMFGLDAESIIVLMEIINNYITNCNIEMEIQGKKEIVKPSVIIATHQLEYAEHYCSDFFLLSKNKIKTVGTKEKIFQELNVKDLNSAFIKSSGRDEIINNKIKVIRNLF